MSRNLVALALAAVGLAMAIALGRCASQWNAELAIESPLAHVAPMLDDPHTPRLARRVVLIVIDGLGADEAGLPFLDELRARGAGTIARVPYPTVSRPNYVTILTGVPPRDSGVRANRVAVPVAVDTVMDRVRAAGMRVATASDYGSLASLFLRGTASLDVGFVTHGTSLALPPPVTWPFDEARRAGSLDELEPILGELVAGDAGFVAVLVLDVDRAGHADGVGDSYRAAARAVDRMLRAAFAKLDLSRDAVVVTADHGHVSPGGHGGDEREVSLVPVVVAGSGIVRGATARDAQLVDVAPTIAALLGVPAPGHAEGRALSELLALDPSAASKRAALDDARARTMTAAAHAGEPGIDVAWLAVALAAAALAIGAGLVLRGAIALGARSLAGATALAVIPIAMVLVTRGHLSPSYIPTLDHVEKIGAVAAAIAIALQLVASWLAIRRATDRLATANGVALTGLALAFVVVAAVRAWHSPPFLDPPSPAWMVGVPTLELGGATVGAATLLSLATARRRRATRPASDARR